MLSTSLNGYPISMGDHLSQAEMVATLSQQLGRRLAIITDSNLVNLYGQVWLQALNQANCLADLLVFPAGEPHKNRDTKAQLEDELLRKHYGRDSALLALGGGVVTDLVGFLAATYCRGVPVIYLPTTLLAMVDASIGGKTGVNTPMGKNLIGTFTHPYAVCMDLSTLQTLPDREWRNGIAEIIKHALIADATLFAKMQVCSTLELLQNSPDLAQMIQENCAIKQAIVAQDTFETNRRHLLNFGHTIGHAIEALEHYQLAHGEAVAIGLLVECQLAVEAGYLSPKVVETVYALLHKFGLPLTTQVFQNKSRFLQTLALDKKSIRSIPRFVLLTEIGQPYVHHEQTTHEVAAEHLDRALDWALATF